MRAETRPLWEPPAITALDRQLAGTLRTRIDGKAKPPGSLGRIEDLAVQLGMIRHPAEPRIDRAILLVFAADHGLTEEGVSQYPSAVTVPDHPELIAAKIRMGTANAAREPAMTPQQAADALARGCKLAIDEIRNGADIIALGEMGIGNTASSALLVHRLAPAPLLDCIGVGAGQDDAGMTRKRAAIEKAAARSNTTAPFDVLCEFGGLEIAMMAGAVLGAASQRRPVLVDGFISSAAALVAIRLDPAARDYCIFAHRSAEKGHDAVLAALEAKPLLDLGLRLGEGTGALLAVPLVRAAARLLTDVADLSDVLAGNI